MPVFGAESKARLQTCHPALQGVLNEVIKYIDFSVLEGYRSPKRQFKLFLQGRKQLPDGQFVKTGHTVTNIDGVKIKGKHNYTPSLAVDIAPYPIDFSNREKARERFYFLMGMVKMQALMQGVELTFGLDWDSDNEFDDQSFDDLPHLQLRTL